MRTVYEFSVKDRKGIVAAIEAVGGNAVKL